MIHGLFGSLAYFDPASRISNATVYPFDLLGYGELTGVHTGRLTMQGQVEHAVRQLRALSDRGTWVLCHSMGGVIAMLLADQHPDLVHGIINVEGNFTLKDAFFSGKVAVKTPLEWDDEYQQLMDNTPAWAKRWCVSPTPQHLEWCKQLLLYQPATTVRAMSEEIVATTREPSYGEVVRRVVRRGLPIHLIAGEESAGAWDVPDFVRSAAASDTVIPGAGHLMMLDDPDAFCKVVDGILLR
jgi:pimeloyl-ACP methyl ester carboxylesterase